jgi:hypothetical protein
VPEKSSGDAQGMCEHVLRSLEFPKQLDEPVSQDPPDDNEQ